MPLPKKLIVAITGATGAVYGVRLLQSLSKIANVETHLVVSNAGALTLQHELGVSCDDIGSFAHAVHDVHDLGAAIASGSFLAEGMIVAPCTMKTLAAIAHGLSDNLIARAADVILKERRRLVLMVRETPFHLVHLRNMTAVTEMGGIIFPPLPSFYRHPHSIDEMVGQTIGRVLDLFNLPNELAPRWDGLQTSNETPPPNLNFRNAKMKCRAFGKEAAFSRTD